MFSKSFLLGKLSINNPLPHLTEGKKRELSVDKSYLLYRSNLSVIAKTQTANT